MPPPSASSAEPAAAGEVAAAGCGACAAAPSAHSAGTAVLGAAVALDDAVRGTFGKIPYAVSAVGIGVLARGFPCMASFGGRPRITAAVLQGVHSMRITKSLLQHLSGVSLRPVLLRRTPAFVQMTRSSMRESRPIQAPHANHYSALRQCAPGRHTKTSSPNATNGCW